MSPRIGFIHRRKPVQTTGLTYESMTNWARPAFTPVRDVPFTTVGGLNTAISGMVAGDYIHYTGTGVLNNTSSGSSIDFLQSKNPASTVVIDLGTRASGNWVKFSYTGTIEFAACYCFDCSNLQIYGGEMTCPNGGGTGLDWFGPMTNVLWWDFVSHDCGSDTLKMLTIDHSGGVGRTIQNCSFRGEVYGWGQNTTYDPHAEKGTGLHGAQLGDTNPAGDFKNNVVALYAHDSGCGAGIQLGSPVNADFSGNTIYVKAANLTMVAVSQVAANSFQIWSDTGSPDFGNTVVRWCEGSNLQGRVLDMQGLSPRAAPTDLMTVIHGRHANTNQNPNLAATEPGIAAGQPYDDRGAITYSDCT